MVVNELHNVLQFQFPDNKDELGMSIYAYISGNEAVIIDTGYEVHYQKVKEELDNRNISIKMAILTHFHPDHIGGLPYLRNIPIYGSQYAEETLSKFYDKYDEYLPTIVVKEKQDVTFNDTIFTLIPNPSHSKCTMLILVDEFSFIGDECMFFDDGSQSMPYASETLLMHRDGTKYLRTLIEGTVLCPSHGKMTKCTMYLKFVIMYFNHIMRFPNSTYEEFSNLYKVTFKNTKLHSMNRSKARKEGQL